MTGVQPATDVHVRAVRDDEIADYRRDGWAKLPGLIPADVAAEMLEVGQAHLSDTPPQSGAQSLDLPMWREWRYLARDVRQEPFRSVAYSARLGENLSRLEGHGGGIRYWKDTVSCKLPAGAAGGSTVTGWHQDFPAHPMDRLGGGTFWIALDDVEEDQGAMTFLTGSHKAGPLGRTFTNGPKGPSGRGDQIQENPWLVEQYPSSGPVALRPGDATVHHPLTVHGTGVNATGRPRWAFIVFYGAAEALYTGASYPATDGLGLEVDKPFDHPAYAIVWPGEAR
jgi:ectoine hydroxylase-related dioxygenase (phytanoyl-CoA dioxygenase family)